MDNNEKIWRDRVAEFRSSGMSVSNWCRNHGCKRSVLKYWLNRFDSEHDVKWTEIVVGEESEPVIAPGNMSVIYQGFEITLPLSELDNLIKAVKTYA